jgi:hypothetical protein
MRRRRRPDQSRFADTVFAGGIAPIAVELGGSFAHLEPLGSGCRIPQSQDMRELYSTRSRFNFEERSNGSDGVDPKVAQIVSGRLSSLVGCGRSDYVVFTERASHDLKADGHAVLSNASANGRSRLAGQVKRVSVVHPRH